MSKKKKTKKQSKQNLTPESEQELLKWGLEVGQSETLPDSVRTFLQGLADILEGQKQSHSAISNLQKALSLSMRITPSSERMDARALSKDSTRVELEEKLRMVRQILRFASKKAAEIQEELSNHRDEEFQQETVQCENQNSADGKQSALENETVFSKSIVQSHGESVGLESRSVVGGAAMILEDMDRDRDDVVVTHRRIKFTGQLAFDPSTGEKFDYDFSLIGPAGSRFTWRTFVTVAAQVVGLGMPLSRLETMLGGKPFTRQNLHRMLGTIAAKLTPIYLQLCDDLAQSDVIFADDTHTKVHQVSRAIKDGQQPWAKPKEPEENNESDPENTSNDNADFEPIPKNTFATLRDELGYQFAKVRNPKQFKTQHLTSCAHGVPAAGQKRVVIYRSHLGSAGNLLDKILEYRKSNRKMVTIVADLSSSNLVRNESVTKHFEIAYAGCAAHARRDFYRYAEHDIDTCLDILDRFKFIFIVEDDLKGAGPAKILHSRTKNKYSEQGKWQEIKAQCELLTQKFSDATPLGEAARYVIRNYEALTLYLTRPELPATNNQTERLLRYERLCERNTYGSKTMEGRARMDVLRSIFTTCRFSECDELIYLLKILIIPDSAIAAHPQNYTPAAIAKHLNENPEDRVLLNDLLTSNDFKKFVKPSSNFQRKSDTAR